MIAHQCGFIHDILTMLGHDGIQEVVLVRQYATLKQVLCQVRHGNIGQEGGQHCHGLEWEPLLDKVLHFTSHVMDFLLDDPTGVVDERRDFKVLFPSTNAKEESNKIGGHRAVGIGTLDEQHAKELGKDDDVDQVRAQVPQAIH